MSDLSETIRAGIERARENGRLGGRPKLVSDWAIRHHISKPPKEAAAILGMSVRQFLRRRAMLEGPKQRKARLEREARRPGPNAKVTDAQIQALPKDLRNKEAAARLGVSISTLMRRRRLIEQR